MSTFFYLDCDRTSTFALKRTADVLSQVTGDHLEAFRLCVGDTHIGAASSDEAGLHIKSSTGPPTSRDPHPSSLLLEANSNTTSSILGTV